MAGKEPNGGEFQLWKVGYPLGETSRVTSDLNGYFRVSQAAVAGRVVTAQESASQSIWVAANGEAGKAKAITSGAAHYDGLAWTPEGRLVYASDETGEWKIWTADGEGNERKQLTRGTKEDHYPVVSTDGRKVYYVSCDGHYRGCDLWKMESDGKNARQLTQGSEVQGLQVTPDDEWIVYTAPGATRWSTLWKVPVEGGPSVAMSSDLAQMPAVSPDGKWVACFYTKGERGIRR